MSPTVLQDPGLYPLLIAIDEELTAAARAQGCSHCGAKLHEGGFPRKPRGCPALVPARLLVAHEPGLFALAASARCQPQCGSWADGSTWLRCSSW